ncbi:MAG: hypothetical protein VX958_07850 [Planctomycetota bacterium]|nr:hypothetical protein [Planctomycetota bacterium]
MSKKLTHNKIHRGAPEPQEEKSQVVAAVEDLASSTKSKVKRMRTPLIVLLVLVLVAVLASQIFQEIKAGQEDQLQENLYLLTSSPPAAGQEETRVKEMRELLQTVKGQPQEKSFYLEIVATLLEQADPAVTASANPFSLTPVSAGSNDDDDTGRKKLLAAAGQLAREANEKFGTDMDEWNQKIQAMVNEDADKSWLGKPRSYRLLVPEKKASSK